MSCGTCPGCGQFCDYPACMPGYVPPPPVDEEALRKELLEYAAKWRERVTTFAAANDVGADSAR